jgi:hypothetical protein
VHSWVFDGQDGVGRCEQHWSFVHHLIEISGGSVRIPVHREGVKADLLDVNAPGPTSFEPSLLFLSRPNHQVYGAVAQNLLIFDHAGFVDVRNDAFARIVIRCLGRLDKNRRRCTKQVLSNTKLQRVKARIFVR